MHDGFVLVDKQTGRIRYVDDCIVFAWPYSAKKALRKECKRLKINADEEVSKYRVVEFRGYLAPSNEIFYESVKGYVDRVSIYFTKESEGN